MAQLGKSRGTLCSELYKQKSCTAEQHLSGLLYSEVNDLFAVYASALYSGEKLPPAASAPEIMAALFLGPFLDQQPPASSSYQVHPCQRPMNIAAL